MSHFVKMSLSPSRSILFFVVVVYLFLREREREAERERIPSRLHTVSTEPDAGLELTNRESMTCVTQASAHPHQ